MWVLRRAADDDPAPLGPWLLDALAPVAAGTHVRRHHHGLAECAELDAHSPASRASAHIPAMAAAPAGMMRYSDVS